MRPERDFCLWLDRRDAEALGRVFDALGGKLLLLATQLAGPREQAQDLVQSAFLKAMARGASWDRQRPVWPWLAAILHNEIRMRNRGRRRLREVALDDVDAAPASGAAGAADPAELAASEEVLARVLAAIDALPLPYRQVLRLRLVHGLRPVDIARSLEVPVGTVRAQLHRGLEQLRAALPTGVVGLLGMLLTSDEVLLAQVRQHVLENAAEYTAPVVAGSAGMIGIGGLLSMHAKTLGGVVAGLIALACLVLAALAPGWFEPTAGPVGQVEPVVGAMPVGDAGPVAAPIAVPTRALVDAAAEPTWPLTVTVLSAAGQTVPGAIVSVWTAPNGGAFWNRQSADYLRADVVAGATDDDGVFRSSLDVLHARSDVFLRTQTLWLEASSTHGRARRELMALPKSRANQLLEVTIELPPGRGVCGRVVDAAGSAVVGADVRTVHSDRLSSPTARTAGDGSFFIECGEDGDDWPSHVAIVDAALGARTVSLPARPAGEQLVDLGTIVLAPEQPVRGVVELADGSALAGIQVSLQQVDESLGDDRSAIRRWLMQATRKNEAVVLRDGRAVVQGMQTNTAADGSFQFAGLDPAGTYFVQLWLLGDPVDAVVHPGDDPVRLRVDGQLITIEVVDENGEPVSGVRLNCEGYDPDSSRPSWGERPGFPATGQACSNWPCYGDPDGRRVMVSPFGFTWRIGTVDDSVQPAFARHVAFPGIYRATCRLVLRPETGFGKLHVVAVDEQGAPIEFGAALTALDRDLQHNDRRMVSPPEGWTWELPAGRWTVRTVLGKEVIYLDTNEGFARGYQEQVVTITAGDTTELKVTAAPAGLVAFRLHAAPLPPAGFRDLRIEVDGRAIELHAHHRESFDLRPAARSAVPVLFVTRQALPPGLHTFCVQVQGMQPAVGEVDVVADRLTTVRVELQHR